MQVEEIFIWGKKRKKNRRVSLLDDYYYQSPSSVANQNAGFVLVHQLGDTDKYYVLKFSLVAQLLLGMRSFVRMLLRRWVRRFVATNPRTHKPRNIRNHELRFVASQPRFRRFVGSCFYVLTFLNSGDREFVCCFIIELNYFAFNCAKQRDDLKCCSLR